VLRDRLRAICSRFACAEAAAFQFNAARGAVLVDPATELHECRCHGGAALPESVVPSLGEKTPPFNSRPVARPRSAASRLRSLWVVTPAVLANSRQRAQRAISSSSLLR
jgi:hypothetical protein